VSIYIGGHELSKWVHLTNTFYSTVSNTQSESSILRIIAGMVNFHDPAIAALDFSAYPSPSGSGSMQHNKTIVFHSGSREALAHRRWPLHVGLLWPLAVSRHHIA
jgi:hypothetical protein